MRGNTSISIDNLEKAPRSVVIVSRFTPLPAPLKRIADFLEVRWPNISVRTMGDARQIAELLRQESPDLILIAEDFPEASILDALALDTLPRTLLARVRANGVLESIEISLPALSGDDCLAGRVVDLLQRRARTNAKRRFQRYRLDRLIRKNERFKQLSLEDPLTRIFNRRGFHRFFRTEWSRATRYQTDIACVMVDIDDFKRLNDTYGHSVGDRVLRRFADLVRSSCRASDIFGRIGGEEFCAVLPSCNEHQAVLWAEKIRRRIAATPLYSDTGSIRVTASFGVASAQATLRDEHELIELADRAMLVAKHRGRNCVVASSTIQGKGTGDAKLTPASRIVRLLLESLALRDPETAKHSQRVSQYATLLAKEVGLADNEIWITEVGGLLHDIGKMGLPDAILQKPAPLEPTERLLVEQSLASSSDIVRNAFGTGPLLDTVRGSRIWFRDANREERTPISARIIAIADAYDSMTSPHPYREPLAPAEALAELARCTPDQFDKDLVQQFSAMIGTNTAVD